MIKSLSDKNCRVLEHVSNSCKDQQIQNVKLEILAGLRDAKRQDIETFSLHSDIKISLTFLRHPVDLSLICFAMCFDLTP